MRYVLVVLTILAAASAARAQDPEHTRAEAYMKLANDLYDQGEYAAALEEYRHALPHAERLGEVDAALWNIARCHEELEQWAEAIDAFEVVAGRTGDPTLSANAREKASAIAARVFAAVTVRCEDGEAVAVRLDGGDARPCPTTWARVPAGPVAIEVSVSGLPAPTVRESVEAGRTLAVTLPPTGRLIVRGHASKVTVGGVALPPMPADGWPVPAGRHAVVVSAADRPEARYPVDVLPGRVAEVQPEPAPPPAVEAPSTERGPWPWVAAGVGVAAAIGGGALLVAAADSDDEAQAAYARWRALPGSASDAELAALESKVVDADDRAVALRTGGWIALGAAAVAGGVAAWLWLDESRPAAAPTLDVSPAPGGATVSLRGGF